MPYHAEFHMGSEDLNLGPYTFSTVHIMHSWPFCYAHVKTGEKGCRRGERDRKKDRRKGRDERREEERVKRGEV